MSTDEQCLDLQLSALRQADCDEICMDHGVSGSRQDRPGLNEVLAGLKPGDTLVVWRLDRLGRSLSHLLALINDFRARGIHFASLTELIDTGTPTGMFTFHMIAALAEFERALISERTRAGVAAARDRGKRLGRPRALDDAQVREARVLLRELPESEVAIRFRVHHRTLRKRLREFEVFGQEVQDAVCELRCDVVACSEGDRVYGLGRLVRAVKRACRCTRGQTSMGLAWSLQKGSSHGWSMRPTPLVSADKWQRSPGMRYRPVRRRATVYSKEPDTSSSSDT